MRRGDTFEKWYSSGNDILRDRFPSLDEPPSTVTVSVSADDRLLRRLKDLDFDPGGWTPFSSKVRSSASSLFKSRYLITLLFVSAMKSLPAKYAKKHFHYNLLPMQAKTQELKQKKKKSPKNSPLAINIILFFWWIINIIHTIKISQMPNCPCIQG